MNKRKIGSLILSLALLTGSVAPMGYADAKKFKDLKDDYWATEFIKVLVESGILSGYTNGTFAPEQGISREEFAVVLYKTFGLDEYKPTAQTFRDVDASRWSYGYVEAAKEYLTGYFPPNGKATFVPEGAATREDVAVALVRALNIDLTEKGDPDDLEFRDVSDISPGLRDEIALAVNHELIAGFPDKTFRPDAPITRAQASAMVYKVIKSTWVESNVVYATTVKIPETVTTNKVPVTVTLPEKSKLIINDELVSYSGKTYTRTFALNNGNDTYTFTFKVQYPNGKVETITKKVLFQANAPEISISNWTETSSAASIVVKGTLKDSFGGRPTLKVNGIEKTTNSNNSFEVKLPLQKGLNTFTFTVIDKDGKTAEVTKSVTYNASAPAITLLTPIPEIAPTNKLTVKFAVKDASDDYPTVTVNGTKINKYFYEDAYTTTLSLQEGYNTILIEVKNRQGITSSQTFKTQYTVGSPQITFVTLPETSDKADINIGLRIVDAYDYAVTLMVNDKKYTIANNDVKTIPYTLNKGDNKIVFQAINSKGKTTVVEKVIKYDVAAPKVSLTSPLITNKKAYTLSLLVSDANYKPSQLGVKVNGKVVTPTLEGKVTFPTELLDGKNLMTVEVINPDGKLTTTNYTVSFETTPPVITANVPDVSLIEDLSTPVKVIEPNGNPLKLTQNGKDLLITPNSSGVYDFTLTQKLIPGNNTLTLTAYCEATGKTTTLSKLIKFAPAVPVVNLSEVPATVAVNTLTLTGNVSDTADKAVVLKINNEVVLVTASGNFTKTLTLIPGENKITILAINKYGLITQMDKTIKFEAPKTN